MRVKNISGTTHTFGFDRKTARTIENNETITIPDSPEAIAAAVTYRTAGLLAIVEGATTVLQSRSVPNIVRIQIGAPGALVDETEIDLGGEVFELDDDDAVTSGNTAVEIDALASVSAASLKTAINANATLAALGVVAGDILVVGNTMAYLFVTLPDTLVLADFVATSSNACVVVAKVTAVAPEGRQFFSAVVLAAGTSVVLHTGLSSINEYFINLRDATGVCKAYDGKVIVSGGSLYLDASGSADIANTDKLHILALGVA